MLSNVQHGIILIIFVTIIYSIMGDEISDLINQSNNQNSSKVEAEKEKKNNTEEIQKELLIGSVDKMSDREIDEYLERLGQSQEGSIYAKRKRLKDSLSANKEPKNVDPLNLPKKEKRMPISIKSAAEGEFVSVDKTETGVLVLRGKVKLNIQGGVLEADLVSIDSEKGEIYAEGGIRYVSGNSEAFGDKFIYDYNLQRGVIYKVRGKALPVYFLGEKIKKLDEDRFLLEMGYFTTCNAEKPHYSFLAKKVVINKDKTVGAVNVLYKVGGIPVFWFPFVYNSRFGNGWILQAGKNNSQGNFVQTTYRFSIPKLSFLLPMGYQIRLDYYEKTGQAIQLEFWKITPWLNYTMDFGYANHKRYEVTSAYEDRFMNYGIGNTAVTNQVDKGELFPNLGLPYRKTGIDVEPWWKARIFLNAKKNDVDKDATRNLQFQFEYYTNRLFEYEYGRRYEPSNSFQSVYTKRDQRLAFVRNNLDWKLDYTENRKDLSVNINMRRNMLYYLLNPSTKSGYYPTVDVLPETTVKNSTQLFVLPFFNSPVYWDILLNNRITRYYGPPVQEKLSFPLPPNGTTNDPFGDYKESTLRTQIFSRAETGFKTTMNFGSYLSFTPNIYFGGQKETVSFADDTTSNSALERQLKRDSYQYFRTDSNLRLGFPLLFFSTYYRKVEVRKPELQDPVVGNVRKHELEIALESYVLENWEFSVRSIKDLRTFSSSYDPQPSDKDRWYFVIFRASGYIDFIDGFRKKRVSLVENRRSFYSGIYFNNDYVYHTPKGKALSNHATLSYKMGGFGIPFLIKNFREFEVGAVWYHVYESPLLDRYRLFIKGDIDITSTLGIETELDARATEPWRYTNQAQNSDGYYGSALTNQTYSNTGINNDRTTIQEDLINGTGVNGGDKRKSTAFNINRFMASIRYDIHDWIVKLTYTMDLRSIPGGLSGDYQLTFYDQSIFVTFTFKNLTLGSNETSDSSRFRLYRFKKKPLSAGYQSGITTQGQ